MSRFYLALIAIFCFSVVSFGQSELSKYLKYAEEQYEKGDFYYALDYYQKAMEIDSQSVSIIWSYAETLRAYKDYEKAEYYYGKVYQKEEANIYPASLLQYGLMQKQNGKYDQAIETFKKAKKKYARDKKGYLYQKSRREIESCLWAKDQFDGKYPLKPLENSINSNDAEFGHLILGESIFFLSTQSRFNFFGRAGLRQKLFNPFI